MPQLDTTYFISQIFWLAILFTLFYLSIRFLIIPKLHSIINARTNMKEESDSFVGIVDLEIAQIKIETKKQFEATNILIKKLESSADTKYDAHSRDLLSKHQKKLEQALNEANKKISELTKKALVDESMDELVVKSAKNMILKLANIDVSTNELKNFIKS